MRWTPALLALLAGVASAETIEVDDEPHRVTRVEGKLVGASARFVVRHTLHMRHRSPGYQGELEVPDGAVVIGATAREGGARHPLPLVEATTAREKFDALFDVARPGPRRSAILLEAQRRGSTLQLHAAVPRDTKVELDLEVEMSTCFVDDLRVALVPDHWLQVGSGLARAAIDRAVLDETCSREAPDHTWVAFASPVPSTIFVHGGRLALDRDGGPTTTDLHLARVELDLASELGAVPRDLATAIVVDLSRSMTPQQLGAQAAAVGAYLRAAPDSRVQVIGFARRARPLLAGWTDATAALPLAAAALGATGAPVPTANGSNLDAALDEATQWLAKTTGTKRVLLVGDERLAKRFSDPVPLGKRLPAGVLLHTVVVHGDASELYRSATQLSPLALTTGGMGVGVGRPSNAIDATMLVRPISVDEISVSGPGWKSFEDCPDTLREGRSCTFWAGGDASSGPIAVEGMIWGKRHSRVVRPDPTIGVSLARALTEHVMLRHFDAEVIGALDYAARAINERWSIYGTWGGRGHYHQLTANMPHFSASGSAHSSHGMFGRGTRKPAIPTTIDLAPQLRAAVAACQAGRPVTATIETTLSEIVDVKLDLAGPPQLVTCIEDAIWATHVTVPAHFPAGVSIAKL